MNLGKSLFKITVIKTSHKLVLFFVALTHLLTAQSYREIIDADSSESKEERLELMLDFLKGIDFGSILKVGD